MGIFSSNNEEVRTIVVPDDWSMPYDQESGHLFNPSEVEDLVENGQVLNADGTTMTVEQFQQQCYGRD